jgi:hypothetical protein
MPAIKVNFLPNKPILTPFHDEGVVSYGDRLLWHQLGLQLNKRNADMPTQQEYVDIVMGYYPTASETNVRAYHNYFNSGDDEKGMGFRRDIKMPIQVAFADE